MWDLTSWEQRLFAFLAACMIAATIKAFTAKKEKKTKYKSGKSVQVRGLDINEHLELPIQRWVGKKGERSDSPRIGILTYGTRGDVQPFLALAQELRKNNAMPFIAAPRSFEKLIQEHGLEYVYGGAELTEQPQRLFDEKKSSFADVLDLLNEMYEPLGKAFWTASEGCDMLICSGVTRSIVLHIAEARGVPCFCAHFAASDVPTKEFPPANCTNSLLVMKKIFPSFTPFLNKTLYTLQGIRIVLAAISTGLAKSDEKFRASIGLPKANPMDTLHDVQDQPSLHAYSQAVLQKPSDWPENVIVSGYWTSSSSSQQDCDPGMLEFIQTARTETKKVIFVTFGSMQLVDTILDMTLEAAIKLDVRAIFSLHHEHEHLAKKAASHPSIFLFTSSVPHQSIFPLCDTVIHHGGAGTTAAAMNASVPSIIVPILQWSDQPFWAQRVEILGVGLSLSRFTCSVHSISAAINESFKPAYKESVRQLSRRMSLESNGAALSARLLCDYHASLSTSSMICN